MSESKDVRIAILNDIASYIEDTPQRGIMDTMDKMSALANVIDLRALLERDIEERKEREDAEQKEKK